jgi:cobalt-zinc-cadmium efflux system membrane fusion protein
MVSPGQRVDEADALLRLADARKLMLELNLTVAQAGQVREGDVLLVEGSGEQAKVTQIGWGASDSTQTVRVRAALPPAESGRFGEFGAASGALGEGATQSAD